MDELSVLQHNEAGAKFPSKSHQEAFNHNAQDRAFNMQWNRNLGAVPAQQGEGRPWHSWQQGHSITSLLSRARAGDVQQNGSQVSRAVLGSTLRAPSLHILSEPAAETLGTPAGTAPCQGCCSHWGFLIRDPPREGTAASTLQPERLSCLQLLSYLTQQSTSEGQGSPSQPQL